jgi:hypothetical protein
MNDRFKKQLEEYFKIDHENLFWTALDELAAHRGFQSYLRSSGKQCIKEPFELVNQWIAYNNVICRRMSPSEFKELTYDSKTGQPKPEENWMKLQRFARMIPM